ncbi:hypothetical protein BKA70DRAFT_1329293 [Coprinopsis sp. MPI-PUGE-AT-0042]|nr:hypothetical protein BKA70DRAFT_1329293 [Coprinopsis sp. MPI-PUGE-AT-0042]
MAETLNKEGKQGAHEMNPAEPRYLSNLSAVALESGNYQECIDIRSTRSGTPQNHALAPKLAARLSKAALYGVVDLCQEVDNDILVCVGGTNASPRRASKDEVDKGMGRALHTPVFKSRLDPTKELYLFGHDALRHCSTDMVDLMCIPSQSQNSMTQRRLQLALLFGGVGDGRHAFATLIHAAREDITENLHLTLLDIHPVPIAKLLLIFYLLNEIDNASSEDDKLELMATLTFLYMSMLMPHYAVQRLMKTALALVDQLTSLPSEECMSLYGFLAVSRGLLDSILRVLRQWSTPSGKSSAAFIAHNPRVMPPRPGPHSFTNPMESMRKMMAMQMSLEDDTRVDNSLPIRSRNVRSPFDDSLLRVLIPPEALLDRHPALSDAILGTGMDVSLAREETLAYWEPNPTVLEKDDSVVRHLLGEEDGYPIISGHPHDSLKSFHDFVSRFSPPGAKVSKTVFPIIKAFFDLNLRGKLTIELAVEDLTTGLPRLFSDASRPSSYPKKFTRMWLSNDYTGGTLNTAVFLMPHLHFSPSSMILSKLPHEYGAAFARLMIITTSDYTLLHPDDMAKFLGCTLADPNEAIQTEIGLLPVPDPAQSPSRSELYFWLSNILVNLICAAPPAPMPKRIDQPNNFAAFIHLLIYLNNTDKWSTSAVPNHQTLPIIRNPYGNANRSPVKMNLGVRKADLELAVSDLWPLIPFPLPSSSSAHPGGGLILSPADVVTLQATGLGPYTGEYSRRTPYGSPFSPVVSLAFFKVPESSTYERFVDQKGIFGLLTLPIQQLKDIGRIQILLSQVSVDIFAKNEVTWRIGRYWYQRMKAEDWEMVVFRTDYGDVVTNPVKASTWVEV